MTADDKNSKFIELKGDWDSLVPFHIDEIVDGPNGLKIRISGPRNDDKSGVFAFDTYYGYRNFDEGDVWMHLLEIGVMGSGLFVADQSELLDWAAKQSPSRDVPSGVRHYIISSIDDNLDVLAFDEPSFELTN